MSSNPIAVFFESIREVLINIYSGLVDVIGEDKYQDYFIKIQNGLERAGEDESKELRDIFFISCYCELFDLIPKVYAISEAPAEDEIHESEYLSFASSLWLGSKRVESEMKDPLIRSFLNKSWIGRLHNFARKFDQTNSERKAINQSLSSIKNKYSNEFLISFFLHVKIDVTDNNFQDIFQDLLNKNKWGLNDFPKLVRQIIKELKKGLVPEAYIHPLEHLSIFGFSFSCTKQTADRYLCGLIDVLNSKLEAWGEPLEIYERPVYGNALIEFDDRIDTHLEPNEIESYFNVLKRRNGVYKEVLCQEDIEYLLSKNFKGFPKTTEKRVLQPQIKASDLRRFVYLFFLLIDSREYKGKARLYHGFLKNNFLQFNDFSDERIEKSFAKRGIKNNVLVRNSILNTGSKAELKAFEKEKPDILSFL